MIIIITSCTLVGTREAVGFLTKNIALLVGVGLGIPAILLVDSPKRLSSPQEADGGRLEAELRTQSQRWGEGGSGLD